MDIRHLRIFVEVMRRKSFAAVARDRGVAASSISRVIATLEEELDLRLFQRNTRRLEPSESALMYFERIEPVLEELEHAHELASQTREQPKGTLRISAPVSFGQLSLVPLLPELMRRYPDLSIELLLEDRVVDLLAERIDVAIRLGPLPDSNYVANRLCAMDLLVCASPDYLREQGTPQTPEAVAAHDCLTFPLPGYNACWRFRDTSGHVTEVAVRGRCTISNALALQQCAVAGMGLTLLPRWSVAQAIRDNTLIHLFADYNIAATDFDTSAWLLYPSRHYLPLKVRVFVDFLKQTFRDHPP